MNIDLNFEEILAEMGTDSTPDYTWEAGYHLVMVKEANARIRDFEAKEGMEASTVHQLELFLKNHRNQTKKFWLTFKSTELDLPRGAGTEQQQNSGKRHWKERKQMLEIMRECGFPAGTNDPDDLVDKQFVILMSKPVGNNQKQYINQISSAADWEALSGSYEEYESKGGPIQYRNDADYSEAKVVQAERPSRKSAPVVEADDDDDLPFTPDAPRSYKPEVAKAVSKPEEEPEGHDFQDLRPKKRRAAPSQAKPENAPRRTEPPVAVEEEEEDELFD